GEIGAGAVHFHNVVPVAIGHVEDVVADDERGGSCRCTGVGLDAVELPNLATVGNAQRLELTIRRDDDATLAGEISNGRCLAFAHARGLAMRLMECPQLSSS